MSEIDINDLKAQLENLLKVAGKAESDAVRHNGTKQGYVKAGEADGINHAVMVLADRFELELAGVDRGVAFI